MDTTAVSAVAVDVIARGLPERDESKTEIGRPGGWPEVDLPPTISIEEAVARSSIDTDGSKMRALLKEVARLTPGERLDLSFVPGPKSLQAVGKLEHFEVFLGRLRESGKWLIIRGDQSSVPKSAKIPIDECDMAFHNHPYSILNKAFSEYPSEQDIRFSAGRTDCRFAVLSDDFMVEWSPNVSFPRHPERKLSKNSSADEWKEWLKDYKGGVVRGVSRYLLHAGAHPTLIGSSTKIVKYPWRKVTEDLAVLPTNDDVNAAYTWKDTLKRALPF